MKKSLILIGGGGHCKSVIDVIESAGKFSIMGIVDNNNKNNVFGFPIIGSDVDLPRLQKLTNYAFISVGQIRSPLPRIKIFKYLNKLQFKIPTIVSSSATVSRNASLDIGVIVMQSATIVAGSKIGSNSIINNHVLIDHDCIIGNNCHISTGVTLNGNVSIGEGCFIGSGTIIKEGVTIGSGSFIKMGSKIIKNIKQNSIM